MDIPLLSFGLKMLVFFGYHSTDFEVHRYWMSLTTSLPVDKWYFDETSIWTLDYPPLFAYFEYLLASIAMFLQFVFSKFNIEAIDLHMLSLSNLGYASKSTVFYMRMSVLCTEYIVLGYAVYKYAFTVKNPRLLYISFFLHPGLFLIDHVHFQYNGFLYGILLLSCYYIKINNLIAGGALFLMLCLLKHIYLYIAVGYFVYYLQLFKKPKQLISLIFIFALILVGSFYPFRAQLPQLLSRLFPFKRGLVHALWAPNFWALYIFADRILSKVFKISVPSFTRGIVGDTEFAILPAITTSMTITITLIFYSYFTYKFLKKYDYSAFVVYLQQLAMTSFLFGWHVHEKALLMPALLNLTEFNPNRMSFILQLTSITSQLPLIYQEKDWFLHLIVIIVVLKMSDLYKSITNQQGYKKLNLLCWSQAILILASLILKQQDRYPFLHVMLISVINAMLNMAVFVDMLVI